MLFGALLYYSLFTILFSLFVSDFFNYNCFAVILLRLFVIPFFYFNIS